MLWHFHSLTSEIRSVGIGGICGVATTGCLGTSTYSNVLSLTLDAGAYEFSAKGLSPQLVFEPPPVPATNVACGSAAPLGYQSRVLDAQPRIFSFTAGATRQTSVVFWGTMRIGHVDVAVRTQCGNTSTTVATGSLPYILGSVFSPTIALNFPAVAGQTYSIEVTNITRGIDFNIGVQ